MSNPRAWRKKRRTATPNSRQKRNGLYLDANPVCHGCWSARSKQAHHALWRGHPDRNLWLAMKAFCEKCHVRHHKPVRVIFEFSLQNRS
jgi:hypothetical protein